MNIRTMLSREMTAFASGALVLWLFALPVLAFAQGSTASRLENPLRFSTIEAFIRGLLQAIVLLGIPVIVVFTVYAGFKFVMARGNSSEINKAKENFVYVILGMAMILGAWVLATLLGATVSQLLGGSGGSAVPAGPF